MKVSEKEVQKEERVICLITGESGAGKTFFVANLKDAIIYDTELGGGSKYLEARIEKNESLRVEVNSYVELLNDLKERAANGMKKNVVIDHITNLQQEAKLRHNPGLGSDYGAANERGTNEWRRIRQFAKALDCNLFVVAHLKAKYEKETQVGLTTDGAKNIEGDMGIVLYLRRPGGPGSIQQPTKEAPSQAQVVKWRRDPDDARGQVPLQFSFLVEEFQRIAGGGMTRERQAVELATEKDLSEISQLIEKAKWTEEQKKSWLKKVGVDDFDLCPASSVRKLIAFLKEKNQLPS